MATQYLELPVKGAVVTSWVTYSLTIGGSSSAPTKGTTAVDLAQFRRVGDTMELRYIFRQTAAGADGSGVYLFPLPSGTTVDTAKLPVGTAHQVSCGFGFVSSASDGQSSASRNIDVTPYNSSNVALWSYNNDNTYSSIGSSSFNLGNTNAIFSFTAIIPISGWA